jgi:hypothetical protein
MPCAKSYFAILEAELLERSSVRTQAEARISVFDFIEGWYNPIAVIRRSAIARRSLANGHMMRPLAKYGAQSPRAAPGRRKTRRQARCTARVCGSPIIELFGAALGEHERWGRKTGNQN